jgi:hypothetical protein
VLGFGFNRGWVECRPWVLGSRFELAHCCMGVVVRERERERERDDAEMQAPSVS